ncbi:RNA polymerase sigma factor [Desulfoscipio gibsoniae]
MPEWRELSDQGDCPKQLVDFLYNIGYRLTGSHQQTEELVKDVFNVPNKDAAFSLNIDTALRSMCISYIKKVDDQHQHSTMLKGNSKNKIQVALLTLSPLQRLVLVLREIVRINYSEIAEITGMDKTTVTRLLSSGRWTLRKHLAPPPGQSTLTEKYNIAK